MIKKSSIIAFLLVYVIATRGKFPVYLVAVYVVGFIAAVSIGLVWYNSKRPSGWENAERPDFFSDLKNDEEEVGSRR